MMRMVPPKMWPLDVYEMIFEPQMVGEGKNRRVQTLSHRNRIRLVFFFYANGAWQDFEMLYQLLRPRLASHVSRKYMKDIFDRAARALPGDSTSDGLRGLDKVMLHGRLAPSNYAPRNARRMNLWEEHIEHCRATGRAMPTYRQAEAYFASEGAPCDVRLFLASLDGGV